MANDDEAIAQRGGYGGDSDRAKEQSTSFHGVESSAKHRANCHLDVMDS
jgi:hypothetical protein